MALLFEEETYRLLGTCFEVYKVMGCGFLEAVYQECLKLELSARGVPFLLQAELGLTYKGRPLKLKYVPDFICFEKIILELKAVSQLTPEHRAQVHNYLHPTGYKRGLLVNFGHYPKVEYERIAL